MASQRTSSSSRAWILLAVRVEKGPIEVALKSARVNDAGFVVSFFFYSDMDP